MRHLDEGTIHAWLDDALGADEAARIAAHVDECALCAARVAEARGLIAGASRIVGSLDERAGDVMPTFAPARARFEPMAAPRRRRLVVPSAIAATLIVAAGSLLVTRHTPRADVEVHRVVPSVTPVASAPSAKVESAAVGAAAVPSTRVAARPERRGGARQSTKTPGIPAAAAPIAAAPLAAAPTANVAEARSVRADTLQLRARLRELSAARDAAALRVAAPGESLRNVVATGLAQGRVYAGGRTEFRAASGAPATSVMAALKEAGGCYELTIGQVDVGAGTPGLPSRLVLMQVPVGDTAHRGFLVTSVGDDGARVPELGATWRAIGERGVLTWPAIPEPLTMSFSLAGETRAWLGAPGGTAVPVTVRAERCR